MPKNRGENTNAKAVPVVEKPRAVSPAPPGRECNLDSAIHDMLPPGHPLTNALLWEYVARGDESVVTLTEAINEIKVRGLPRIETNATGLSATYWQLHSKYVAMTCADVRAIYGDILGHVLSLYKTYGDLFMGTNSHEMRTLVERLSGETGPPDEYEVNREKMFGVLDMARKASLNTLITMWMDELGFLPDAEGDLVDRVSFQMNHYYFREHGVIGWCVNLINDFMQAARDKNMEEKIIKYDTVNANYRIFQSCILLGNPCLLQRHPTTKLTADWFADARVVALVDDPEANASVRDEVTGLFVYSNVDPGHGVEYLKGVVEESMEGTDKTGSSYDGVLSAHKMDHERFPPLRVRGGEFPEESVMDNANYALVDTVLNEAVVVKPQKSGGVKRFREPAEEGQAKPVDPPKKKVKPEKRPEETALVKVETVTDDDPNYVLWGGLAAVTAGITAIALSRRRA